MARLVSFVSLALALVSLPSGLAGPGCAHRNFQVSDCVEKCKSKWGWTGSMMGSDPWGPVVKNVDTQSASTLDAVISKACGSPVPTTPTSSSMSTASSTDNVIPTPALFSSASSATPSTSASLSTSSAISSKIPSPATINFMAPPSPLSSSIKQPEPKFTNSLVAIPKETPKETPVPATPDLANFVPVQKIAAQPTNAPQPAKAPPPPPQIKAPAPPPPPPQNLVPPPPPPPPQAPPPPPQNAAPPASSGGGTSPSDIAAYLAGHNTIRAQHGASPLTYSDHLASLAQQWADGCLFKHSGGIFGRVGENLAAGSGDFDIPTAIKAWTDEVSEYNPSNPVASHFTQVVWKATTQVGCAVQTCNGIFDASFGPAKYYVCEYTDAGNVSGQFGENVQV